MRMRGPASQAWGGAVTSGARVAPTAQEQLVPPRAAGESAGVGRWGGRRAALRERPSQPLAPCTNSPCPGSWSVASANGTSWRENFKNCRYKRHASREEAELVQQMAANIKERQNVFFNMEAYLPKKNGLYLNLVLGNVNVTLLSNQAKFAYKDEYEKFKLYLTIILLLGAVACRFVLHYRVTDEVFNFLLVWYYCTLTIRESILISNGSRIKGWWVSHHYVSTFLSGVMLTWPNGLIYQKFRNQFLAFSIFQSCVQFLQYYYQRGCLYRLRALGERNHLDLTVEGFQSWMWRGLTFLLPFLFCGHFWQLYNAVTLFELSTHEECREWQVFVLALTFLILFLGNFLTTLKVVHAKLRKNRGKTERP
uniref:transmembrane protein 120B isoform X1 n=1 Tax=Callithrix jacchus TaxID=9483 RepID=UPI0023DD15C5|nr:transmembrane protein 120B isoform X1 [Callithrix jacchus]